MHETLNRGWPVAILQVTFEELEQLLGFPADIKISRVRPCEGSFGEQLYGCCQFDIHGGTLPLTLAGEAIVHIPLKDLVEKDNATSL